MTPFPVGGAAKVMCLRKRKARSNIRRLGDPEPMQPVPDSVPLAELAPVKEDRFNWWPAVLLSAAAVYLAWEAHIDSHGLMPGPVWLLVTLGTVVTLGYVLVAVLIDMWKPGWKRSISLLLALVLWLPTAIIGYELLRWSNYEYARWSILREARQREVGGQPAGRLERFLSDDGAYEQLIYDPTDKEAKLSTEILGSDPLDERGCQTAAWPTGTPHLFHQARLCRP